LFGPNLSCPFRGVKNNNFLGGLDKKRKKTVRVCVRERERERDATILCQNEMRILIVDINYFAEETK
jgi:hypothetical protein